MPLYSEVVAGGTSVLGGQVGFRVKLSAKPGSLIVDLAFIQTELVTDANAEKTCVLSS